MKHMVQPDRPQMTIWRMHFACWITKATNTHSEYVILIAFSSAAVVTRTRFSVTLPVLLLLIRLTNKLVIIKLTALAVFSCLMQLVGIRTKFVGMNMSLEPLGFAGARICFYEATIRAHPELVP